MVCLKESKQSRLPMVESRKATWLKINAKEYGIFTFHLKMMKNLDNGLINSTNKENIKVIFTLKMDFAEQQGPMELSMNLIMLMVFFKEST